MLRILAVAAPPGRIQQILDFLTTRAEAMQLTHDAKDGRPISRTLRAAILVVASDGSGTSADDRCQRVLSTLSIDATVLILVHGSSPDAGLETCRRDGTEYSSTRLAADAFEATLMTLLQHACEKPPTTTLAVADLIHNPATCQTWRAGREIALSPASGRLLALLMREAPRLVSVERLSAELWGTSPPPVAIIRSHIYTLRAAIDRGHTKKHLRTVFGKGYRPDAATTAPRHISQGDP